MDDKWIEAGLLPCPFCGAAATKVHHYYANRLADDGEHRHVVRYHGICGSCGATGKTFDTMRNPDDAQRMAVEFWNTRLSLAEQSAAQPVAFADRANLEYKDSAVPVVAWRELGQSGDRIFDVPLYTTPPAQPDTSGMVLYCPECSHIGQVSPPALACCPDNKGRMVPKQIAEQARAGFQASIAAQPDTVMVPRIDQMQDPMRPGYFMNYAENETPAEMVLRKLACWLGVGGYNAPTVDADLFHRKIVGGINMLIESAAATKEKD